MLSSLGSSQVSATWSWETVAESPVGSAGGSGAGSGVAGVSARTQLDMSLNPWALIALIRYTYCLLGSTVSSVYVLTAEPVSSATVSKVPSSWISLSRRRMT